MGSPGGGNEVDAGCLDGCLLVRGLSFWLSCLCLGFFLAHVLLGIDTLVRSFDCRGPHLSPC